MAIKKQLVADGGVLSVGVANFSNTVTIVGNTALASANGTNFNASANVTANNISSNNVNSANVVATALIATTLNIASGAATINATAAVLPALTLTSSNTVTSNVGTLNVTTATVLGNETVAGTLGVTGVATFSSNVAISGSLIVTGGVTTVNTTQLIVTDNIITLNGSVSGAPTTNAGVEINRGTSNTVTLQWNETTKIWEISNNLGVFSRIHRADVPIVLGTDTSGAYVANITSSTAALTITGAGGVGSLPSLAIAAANTTTVGILQVVDSTVSTNVTSAASPNSVKTAYDVAIVANTAAAGKVTSVSGTAGRVSSTGGTTPVLDLITTGVSAGTFTKITVDTYGRATANAMATSDDITEGTTNLYSTTARIRGALVSGTGISYDSPSGTITNTDLGSTQLGFKSIADAAGTVRLAATVNQDTLRIAGGTAITATYNVTTKAVNFDSTGVTSFQARTGVVTLTSADVTGALGFAPVQTFNTRTGVVTLTSLDVTNALGYTPPSTAVSSFNTRTGAVTLTSGDVTTALGFTPPSATALNATNLTSGTVPTARIAGSYTGITTVGTLTLLTTTGDITSGDSLVANNGTAAIPSHSFTGDLDTGMYHSAVNTIGWSANGTQKMTLSTAVLTVNGNITATGTITGSSDERLKTNILDISPTEGFNVVMKLNPVSFTRIADGSRSSGYIAQQFQKIAPEQVTEDEQGMLAIDVVGASPYHTAAIQYLVNQIKSLENRILNLENK